MRNIEYFTIKSRISCIISILLNFFQFISEIIDICKSQQLWLAEVNDFFFFLEFSLWILGFWKMPTYVNTRVERRLLSTKSDAYLMKHLKTHADKQINWNFLCESDQTFKMTWNRSNRSNRLCQRENIKSTKKLSVICHSSFSRR